MHIYSLANQMMRHGVQVRIILDMVVDIDLDCFDVGILISQLG